MRNLSDVVFYVVSAFALLWAMSLEPAGRVPYPGEKQNAAVSP